MADTNSNNDRTLLLTNRFDINGKEHRVRLSSLSIQWEREGSSDYGWQVPMNEVVSVQPIEATRNGCFNCFSPPTKNGMDNFSASCSSLERVAFNITALQLHYVQRGWKHRWKLRSTILQNANSMIVHHWITTIQDVINGFTHRPRRLLIFVNPFGGKKRAPKIYQKKVVPLFELAGIDTQVIETERANHAQDLLQEVSLIKLDGIVAVGGDGMVSELLNGLLLRTQKQYGIDCNDSQNVLCQPQLRVGIIPAGSTDAVAYSTTGTNDPVTAALHIIIGDSVSIDVCGVYHDRNLLRYCTTMLAYGYFGDTLIDSEQFRWLGPLRYDWAGFKKVLRNRAYEGELLFKTHPHSESSPRDKLRCRTGCKICERAREQPLSALLKDQENAPESWHCLRGRFIGINNVTLPCMCGLTKEGLSPVAHLGDGCTDLVLIKKCSRLNYMRYLLRSAFHHDDPFALNFVRVFRVREFQFHPICLDDVEAEAPSSEQTRKSPSFQQQPCSSVWNCDGEIVEEPAINVKVFCQLVKLFARGIEGDVYDSSCVSYSKSAVKINMTGS